MNPYIQSLRLRTLPLSVSGIILGTGLAYLSSFDFHLSTFVLAICTTLSLQILSNLCNELGDAQKGTDAEQGERVAYGLQAGTITEKQIRGMIWLFLGLCVLFGTALVYSAFGTLWSVQSLGFLGLGLLAILGAAGYTLGRHSYGYMGLGDLGVLVFFGLLSTLGAYYLQVHSLTWEVVWCGAAIGFPCVGVLNLNNIRDMKNDRVHGKHTFASWLGQAGARVYHTCLLTGCLSIFALYGHWWTLCILPVWTWHLWYVWSHGEKLDKQMPVLMFSTLIVSILALT